MQRRTWRGALRNDAAASAALMRLRDDQDATDARILGDDVAPVMARLVDDATWAFERQAAHHAELWRWLRLDPRDPAYHRDGLTADAMLLSNAERAAARVLMRPGVFRILQSTGLGKSLVAESGATRTAAGFICFCPAADASDYEVGRALYRMWLAATRAGLVLAPMSAIADHPHSRAVIEARLALGGGRRLVQIFRAGTIDRQPPQSPRLPVEELLIVL
jgi:nitroreductase